jgi:O-antigen ligase
VTILLAITGPSLHHLCTTTVLDCHANADCATAGSIFLRNDGDLQSGVNVLVEIVPALIGLFWGPPSPAMASALVVFVAARLAVAHWARPYLLSPLRLVVSDTAFVRLQAVWCSVLVTNARTSRHQGVRSTH